ncbi:MAG: AAA family ATPase [Lachnospiraceae bacterium]|nr:AAA family ATPase [Lachnospiraceae bacterium]
MNDGKKALPVGIEFFQDFKLNNFYYVDKTALIAEFLRTRGAVNLFTRPRRFGKSLNMDMLKSFFEIGADASLFEGLDISKETELCGQHMGRYPVISLSLKDVEGGDYADALEMMAEIIKTEARRHQHLLESDRLTDIDKESLKRLYALYLEESVQKGSLNLLSEMLRKHYGRRVVILIDEYDVPLDKAYQGGYYPEMVKLIRSFLSRALKTNKSLEFAVLTGCLRIARESIFTGLNNFNVFSISDSDCAEYFGFTDGEVKEMLRYYGVEDRFPDMKDWYDGYHFGDVDVYCPWDVIVQCRKLRKSKDAPMEPHWENSSSNAIIRDILEDATEITKGEIEALISGEAVEKEIIPEMTYTDLDSEDAGIHQTYLWSVLYSTGYLTDAKRPEGRIHKLVIPNKEIRKIYEDRIRSWFRMKVTGDTSLWERFCKAVKTGDAETIQELFGTFLSESISIRDTAVRKEKKENFFHGLFLGLLRAEGSWIVKSNAESGTGYSDILLLIPREKTGCVIEVKYAEKGAFDAALHEAMEQIETREYTDYLRQEGMETIHKYGLACYRKTCRVSYEKE